MENELTEMLEHLKYEIDMLYQSACYKLNEKKIHTEYRVACSKLTFDDTSGDAPPSITPDSNNYDWVCKNAVIESFGLHSRNIIEFLFYTNKHGYLRAENYFDLDSNDKWRNFARRKANFKRLLNKITEDIVHLTLGRLGKAPEERAWDFAEHAYNIGNALHDFALLLDNKEVDDYIGNSIRQLLSIRKSKPHTSE